MSAAFSQSIGAPYMSELSPEIQALIEADPNSLALSYLFSGGYGPMLVRLLNAAREEGRTSLPVEDGSFRSARANRAGTRDHSLAPTSAEPSAALERAIAIAVEAHAGQTDKAGEPYILHPLRVMHRLSDPIDQIAGVLHDVLEDCPGWTVGRLIAEGIPREAALTVSYLTRGPDVTYDQFIASIATHERARRVKLADLADNMDLSRLPEITDTDVRRQGKYRRAVDALQNATPPEVAAEGERS